MRTMNIMQSAFSVNVEDTMDKYADMVYRIAVVQMKHKSDAEDIFQEVFLRLVQYKNTIESEEHLKAWLIRVTVNCCKKQFDKVNRKKEVAIETLGDFIEDGREDTYEIEEKDNTTYLAVKKLPENYRSVIHLFYYEEYSVREISNILEQSESAIKTKLSRGRDMLRKILKEEQGNERRV